MRLHPGAIRRLAILLPAVAILAPAALGQNAKTSSVELMKTPDGGIQPQAVVDAEGIVHLLYYMGDPAAGDLYYVRRAVGQNAWSQPILVNSQPGSAIAIGTIRGGQIAVGKGRRVHVAWNGSQRARPANPLGGSPMIYTRSTPHGTRFRFEPQRNLMQKTTALDGGGTLAADDKGQVYVAWHGRTETDPQGEAWRSVWIARSDNGGETFGPELRAIDAQTGACGCCGTRAIVDRLGNVSMLYRAATSGVNRDMMLLQSTDGGVHFRNASLSPWRTGLCPMSSESLADTEAGLLAAWETEGQVHFARIEAEKVAVSPLVAPPGAAGGRKHPAVAASSTGDIILVWTEGTGWQRGGTLAWQVFDQSGKPKGEQRRLEGGIPVWGLATVVARPDGGFLIIH